MQTISCDVCRKKIDEAVTGRSFFYLAQFNICEACKDNLEGQLKPTVRTKDPFTYEWYNKLIVDNLSKSVSKGR